MAAQTPEQIMQHLLAKGLLTKEEVQEARRLLEEAARQGQDLALPEALLRAGASAAKARHATFLAVESAGEEPPAEEEKAAAQEMPGSGVKLLERLGRGSQAVVYKCHEASTDRIVAVKFLLASAAGDADSCQRFLQEARNAAKLTHPNIITVHRIAPFQKTFYIVMEYIDGGSVADLLAIRKRLDPAEAILIVRQTAEGLKAAHKVGLIHRDIKPQNIMLTREGMAKLADMGLARHVDHGHLDQEGKVSGTPYYISPEQITGDPPVDFRTDLYSLGATFYEMLTGRPPFTAMTPQEIMRKHVIEPLPDARQFVPDLPEPLCWFLAKAMAKEPEDRYESAADFIDALDALDLSGTETSAGAGANDLAALAAEERRRSGRVAVIAKTAAATAAKPGAGKPGGARTSADGKSSKKSHAGKWALLVGGIAFVVMAAVGAGVVIYMMRPAGDTRPAPPVAPPPPATTTTPGSTNTAPKAPVVDGVDEKNARDVLREAKEYEAKPDVWAPDVVSAYENVMKWYPNTKAAAEARQCLEKFRAARAGGDATPPSPATPPATTPAATTPPAPEPPTPEPPKPEPPTPEPAKTEPPAPELPKAEPAQPGDTITLKAADAKVRGKDLKYETGNGKDNVGFWNDPNGSVNWQVRIDKPGEYAVSITFAVMNTNPNEFTISVGDQSVTGKMHDTGEWTKFVTEPVGNLKMAKAGTVIVTVKAKGKLQGSLMNLKGVELKRVK